MISGNRNFIRRIALFGLLAVGLGACAIGNTYDYRAAAPKVNAALKDEGTVAVIDRRPYILSGRKSANFVGLQRAGLGNPWNVKTTSGQPFASDFQAVLVRSLQAAGMTIKPSNVPHSATKEAAIGTRARIPVNRSVLLIVREWKTDTYARVTLHFDLELEVYDKGRLLASKALKGVHAIGAAGLPSRVGILAVSNAKSKIEQLINDPKILDALRNDSASQPIN